ncbi:N-acetyltransferase family protein [Aquabacterium sp.]|uniref:GNAT family N-acetyltransferase n=1 Tax=Aquabacterium sp. TaxID=1872578 RepID=UPI0035B271E0
MTIRPATICDAKGIAEVHVHSWQAAYRQLLPDDFLAALSVEKREVMWGKLLAGGKPSLLVAESAGKLVGFSAFGPCRDEGAESADYELEAIYVAPPHWSSGVGRELWLSSLDALLAVGAKSISLWVLAGNERAIRFYQAAGFHIDHGMATKVSSLGGVQVHEVRYIQRHGG